MKRLLFIFILFPVIVMGAEKPDTLEIFYLHNSLGSYLLDQPSSNPRPKVIIEYHLSDSLNWPINWYDYRANSTVASATAGFRSNCLDSSAAVLTPLGLKPPYHYDTAGHTLTTWNLNDTHLVMFWDYDIDDPLTPKARILKDFIVVDTGASPDSNHTSTSNDVFWFEVGPLHYADLDDNTAVENAKAQYQYFRDSTLVYPNIFFILAGSSPLSYWSTYGNTQTDNANAVWLDVWAMDTLQDSISYPNFRYLSIFRALADLNNADTLYGTLDTNYLGGGAGDPDVHPNNTGSQVAQDSAVAFISRLIRNELQTYWDNPAITITGGTYRGFKTNQ